MPDESEMQAPTRIKPKGLSDYLEVMSKAVFKSGMAWRVVDAKWDGIREAFLDFDVERVASMSEAEIDALAQDTRVIRNRRKLNAIVSNAARMVELDAEHGTFKKYLKSGADYDATSKLLRKDFKFLGDFGSYYFLYVVGEPVPDYHEWRDALEAKSRR
jgi:3-methyladenine DNA glycosylase Tag